MQPLPAVVVNGAELALDVVPAVQRAPETVDTRFAVFDVDPFYAVLGRAQRISDITSVISPVMSVGGIRQIETFPDPATEVVDSQARWLPQPARYPANLQWFPFSVAGDVDQLVEGGESWSGLAELTFADVATSPWINFSGLSNIVSGALGDLSWYSSAGSPPVVVENYTFFRRNQTVTSPAMSIRPGRYLFSDTLTLETSQLTMACVAVLRAPVKEWYTLVEVSSGSDTQGPISLRYHRDGALVLWCDGVLIETPVAAGLTRPNRPVLVVLAINFDSLQVSLTVVDSVVRTSSTRLEQRPALQPRLYLGRSAQAGANASMDVLEFDVWSREFTSDGVAARVAQLDRLYGVSA